MKLRVLIAFLATGAACAAFGGIVTNDYSWVRGTHYRLNGNAAKTARELGYEDAAQRIFAAEEWVQSQDWTGREEPCAVQVALKWIHKERQGPGAARGGVG